MLLQANTKNISQITDQVFDLHICDQAEAVISDSEEEVEAAQAVAEEQGAQLAKTQNWFYKVSPYTGHTKMC